MIDPIRLLASAFAGADLLFEIDHEGTILFATGDPNGFSGQPNLEGRPAADLFLPGERARFFVLVRGLTPAEHIGPLPMTLASGEKATLAMCYMPNRERIACTLVKPGKDRDMSPEQSQLALRYAIGRVAEAKLKTAPGGDHTEIFEQVMRETLARAQAFHTTVADGRFDLVFEAIVNLKTGVTSHYEALTRFEPGQSPADTICFAEDLGIADSLDLAVAAKAFHLLERDSEGVTSIAINVSGPTVAKPTSFAMLAALLAKKCNLAERVRIEITETAEIHDLAEADKAIQSLRRMGYRVGIDDFGAGAASPQYLRNLRVDFVKIDGGVIQRLGKSPRDDAMIEGVIASCVELGIDTVAEWIDSPEILNRCVGIGIQFGQGRQFGEPLDALPNDPSAMPARGRRMRSK